MTVARRLRESIIEAPFARAGDVRPQSIEYALALLVGIESVVDELAQEPSALRCAERRSLASPARLTRPVFLHVRDVIAHRSRA